MWHMIVQWMMTCFEGYWYGNYKILIFKYDMKIFNCNSQS